MSYKRIRIDFNHGEKCIFCAKRLTSYTGVLVLELETGTKVWSGPSCAQQKSVNPKDVIPDLVKASYIVEPKEAGEENRYSGKIFIETRPDSPTDVEALVYLILRQEKLRHITGIAYEKLDGLYELSQSGTLTNNNILYLKRLMVKNNKENKKLGLQWLRNLHACETSLQRCLDLKPESDFFKGLLTHLHSKKHLTPNQIIRMNEELDKVGFKHKVSPTAFEL